MSNCLFNMADFNHFFAVLSIILHRIYNLPYLYLHKIETGEVYLLFREYSVIPDIEDIRCDLRNRWNTTGDKFSFDSTRNGIREICEVDLTKPIN